MRNKSLVGTGALLLLLVSCKKEIIDAPVQEEQALVSAISQHSASAALQACDVLSFPIPAQPVGITSVMSDNNVPVAVTVSNSLKASIFDTGNPAMNNRDMGTPNEHFSPTYPIFDPAFPGKEDANGEPGGSTTNSVALGGVLVLQMPGVLTPLEHDYPEPGATISLVFPNPVTVQSIQVLDIEVTEGERAVATLLDVNGNQIGSPFLFPVTGSNGVKTLDLQNTPNVKTVRLLIVGSMGFDNLVFCTPPTFPCTYTQGYWKNHPDDWPVPSLVLGTNGKSYTKAQLIEILKTPVRGNGLISLAHQLIAAKLNVAKGADPSAVSAYITQADQMIGNLVIPGGSLPTSVTSFLTTKLDAYNNGLIGPGHCD